MSIEQPNSTIWTDEVCQQVFSDFYYDAFEVEYYRLNIVPGSKSENHDLISYEMHELLFLYQNTDSSDPIVIEYIVNFKKNFPKLVRYMTEMTYDYTPSSRLLSVADCKCVTYYVNRMAFLVQSLDDYNQKRADLGLQPVVKIDTDWKDVLVQWQYRVDGDKYQKVSL